MSTSKKRFVIGVENLTNEQEKLFREYLAANGAWWHWIKNFWLFTTKKDAITAKAIRDKLSVISSKNATSMVIEIESDRTWAGQGRKNAKGRNIGDWIRDTWTDE